MPINKEILKNLLQYNFNLEYSQKCIEANKHNNITTTYYLLMKKFKANIGVALKPEKNNNYMRKSLISVPLLDLSIKPDIIRAKNLDRNSLGSLPINNNTIKPATCVKNTSSPKHFTIVKRSSPLIHPQGKKRYLSTGRNLIKIQCAAKTNRSKPVKIKLEQLKNKAISFRRVNKSMDYNLNSFRNSVKPSPRDLSLIFNKIR